MEEENNNTSSPLRISPEIETSHAVELNSMTLTTYMFQEALTTGISLEQLKLYCKFPMRYNQALRKLSREMYGMNGILANTVDYYVSIPSLDKITMCYDNTPQNQKKRKLYDLMIDKINHKLTSRDILLKLCLDGMYIGFMRQTKASNKDAVIQQGLVDSMQILEGLSMDDSMMIQPLDLDFCRILGFQNNDYVVGFDMMYFNAFVGNDLLGEIKNFPPEFVKAYLDYKKDGSKRWFKLDQSKTVVLKIKSNIDEPFGRGLAISALSDMFFSDQYTDSQRSNIIENAGTIRWLTQPEGEKKGTSSLNKDQQTNQYENFKNAVLSNASGNNRRIGKTTTLVLAPGTEVGKLETNTNDTAKTLTDENIKRTSTNLGFASGALNGEGDATYSSLQVNIDLVLTQICQWLEQISWQYTKVFNNLINSKGKDIIKFIYLKTSSLNKKNEYAIAKEMFTLGSGSRMWMYAVGSGDIDTYMALMEFEKSMDMDTMYPPHPIAFTTPGGDTGGAPTKDSNNPNTVASKTNGTNQTPKPSTKK